jgi:hypothetical protein
MEEALGGAQFDHASDPEDRETESGDEVLEKAKEIDVFARAKVRGDAAGKGNGVAGVDPGGVAGVDPGGEVATQGDVMDVLPLVRYGLQTILTPPVAQGGGHSSIVVNAAKAF